MLRLCKKCSFKLKQIDSNEDFTKWECTNPTCKAVYEFPVEKKIEEEKVEVEEEKIVVNVPKYDKTFKTSIDMDNKKEYELFLKKKEEVGKLFDASKFSNKTQDEENVEETEEEEIEEEIEEDEENVTIPKSTHRVNENGEEIEEEYDEEFDEDLSDLDEEDEDEDGYDFVAGEENPNYDPYSVDLDAEDAKFPLQWLEDFQKEFEPVQDRKFKPRGFVCPFCSSKIFNTTSKITTCIDCENKYLNDNIEKELYCGLVEGNRARQKANFKEAEAIITEVIQRNQKEDLCDAYFALGIAQSNIIFRENIKTGKRFATVYEPCEVPFSENPNVIKALEIARGQSRIKFETLKNLAQEINYSFENFNSILTHNGRYTVFICYHQSDMAHKFTKDMLLNLSKITRTFVVGRVNEIIDDNKDLISKIYYGLNSSKVMVLLCTSKEDLASPSVIWRYRSFLSVDREKYVIPVLMNGFNPDDLPEELKKFEYIEEDRYTILNIQKKIHKLLPQAFMDQDYLENRLNKIEECLIDKRFIEADLRAERLLQNYKENPYVYFYKLLAQNKVNNEEKIARVHEDLNQNEYFINAKAYADDELLERLIKYEVTNKKIQELRKKQEKKDKFKKDLVNFFTKPVMQYIYTTILPVILGLFILFTHQTFANVQFVYLYIIVGVIIISTIILIVECKFKAATIFTLIASVAFLFGTTSISRINFMNQNGSFYRYDINMEEKTVCLNLTETIFASTVEQIQVIIPETMQIYGETYKITGIGDYLFKDCQNITKIYIPKTVTHIGKYAFENIQATIEFDKDSVMTEIGPYAFANYSGYQILNLPKNLTTIGTHAFDSCEFLQKENTTVTGIKYTFHLPASVKNIGEYAFRKVWCDIKFSENALITEIGPYAFAEYDCNELELPSSLKKISEYAFFNAKRLTKLIIPSSVRQIGVSAFEGMEKLRFITLPLVEDSNMDYGQNSIFATYFGGNKKLNSMLEYNLMGEFIPLLSVTVNYVENVNNEPKLPKNAFRECNVLKSVMIYSDEITEIEAYSFYKCKYLTGVQIFTKDNNYEINKSLKVIGNDAFSGCENLQNNFFTIPQNVEVIKENAFKGCKKLTNIIIPESVYEIGVNAFGGCTLETVYVLKYVDMTNVDSTKRFSYRLKLGNSEFGKLLLNATRVFVSDSLKQIIGDSFNFKYFYDNTSTEVTVKYTNTHFKGPEDKGNIKDENLWDLLFYNETWQIYTPPTNN